MARERIGTSHLSGTSSRFPAASAETLSGNRTLSLDEINRTQFFAFDPGGAGRNVVLPAEESSEGAFLVIANTADNAEVLTIQDDGTNTVCTPTQSETAIVVCNGTSWFGLVGAAS